MDNHCYTEEAIKMVKCGNNFQTLFSYRSWVIGMYRDFQQYGKN